MQEAVAEREGAAAASATEAETGLRHKDPAKLKSNQIFGLCCDVGPAMLAFRGEEISNTRRLIERAQSRCEFTAKQKKRLRKHLSRTAFTKMHQDRKGQG